MRSGREAIEWSREAGGYRFPFTPYPRGWFAVAWGADLAPGAVLREKAFGRELAVFRTESGEAHVLDAYCPHMGAHLAVEGCVEGESLRCGFHGWRFDGAGSCVEVPFADRPMKTRVRSWDTREMDGMVLVWFDRDAKPPGWEPQATYTDESFIPPRLPDACNWVVRTHVQEIAENSADLAHLPAVHGFVGMPPQPAADFSSPQPSWVLETTTDASGLGVDGTFESEVTPKLQGIGMTQVETWIPAVDLRFRTTIYATPHDEQHVRVRAPLSVGRQDDPAAVESVMEIWQQAFIGDFETDIRIWESKIYHERPLLSPVDGPIRKYREWASQFYE